MVVQEGLSLSTDLALLNRVARGEPEAVESLVRLHGPALYRYCYRRCGEIVEDAEDVAQEALLAAVSLARTYDGRCSILTWLCSIAQKKIADYHRRNRRQKRVPPSLQVSFEALVEQAQAQSDGDPSVGLVEQAVVDEVLQCLAHDEREALLLHYVDGYSVQEVGVLLSRSLKGVEALLTRAKKKCREEGARRLM
ncbi:MAG TPA: RNA polymerase sigma factor [Fimbriimonadaceae bacterium]|nr:RNA polymerase sigma factor [Fimbriimonadaceae bacterium]